MQPTTTNLDKTQTAAAKEQKKGPKFWLDIEGRLVPWDEDTITTEKIIEHGGWDPSLGAIVIDKNTNEERTLQPGEIIELKPGMGFSKKVAFKRGSYE
jgi:hypothetical protein